MEINVLAFGQIADITGKPAWKTGKVKDTDELQKKLTEEFPGLISIKYSIAVNRNLVQKNTDLNDNDTVALLPPFSGG